MTTSYVDIIIRIDKVGGVEDIRQEEKSILGGNINIPRPRRRITTPELQTTIEEPTKDETDTRIEDLISGNKRVISGANFILDELKRRMKDVSVIIDKVKQPDVYESMTQLFGEGHGGKLTFEMYTKLLEFTYDYGKYKLRTS